jgi:hypothetical protein
VDEQGQQGRQDGQFAPAREFALWLRALQSFFNTANHPLSTSERADIAARNFKCETRVVHDTLLRCLHLLGNFEGGEQAQGLSDAKNSLGELSDTLKDAFHLSGALLEAQSVNSGGWAGLGSVLERELSRSDAAAQIVKAGQDADAACVPAPLVALARGLGPDELGEDMLAIFTSFARLLALLRFIESSLRGDAKLKRLLAVFALVNEETRSLLDFIEGRTLRVEGLDKKGREILDGTAYAIRMELRKAFDHELVGFCSVRQPPQIYARAENACGLLRDCYQQSVVALAQSFDPSIAGEKLFESFQTKLEQSLALRLDLWRLIQLVRTASNDTDALTPAQLLEGMNAFHEGSIRHLMYKDWEPLERFMEEVESARARAELAQTLHRFEAFLETLFGQVNMRAVLNGHPFDAKEEAKG